MNKLDPLDQKDAVNMTKEDKAEKMGFDEQK